MPTPTPTPDSELILTALRAHRDGATLEQLASAVPSDGGLRNLRILLIALRKLNRVRQVGSVYQIVDEGAAIADRNPGAPPAPSCPPAADPGAPTAAGAAGEAVAPDDTIAASPEPSAAQPTAGTGAPPPAATPAFAAVIPDATPTAPVTSPAEPTRVAVDPQPPKEPAPPAPNTAAAAASAAGQSAPPTASTSAVPTAPTGATPGAAVPVSAPGGDAQAAQTARFEKLFAETVVEIVPYMRGKQAVNLFLPAQAKQFLNNPEEHRPFVAYAKARLRALTVQEAEGYDITPEEYEAWRPVYLEETAPLKAQPAKPATTEPEEDDTHASTASPTEKKPTAASSRKGTSRLGSPRAVAKAAVDWVMRLTGSSDGFLKAILGSVALGLVGWIATWARQSPLLAITVVVLVIAIAGLVAWAFKRDQPAEADADDTAADGTPAAKREPAVVASAAPNPTDVEARSSKRRRRIAIAAGAIALIVGGAGGVFWYRTGQHPSESAVSNFIVKNLEPLPVRVVHVEITDPKPNKTGVDFQYDAVVETSGPLYRRIDVAEYLTQHAPEEMKVIEDANALLAGPEGARLRSLVGARPTPDLVLTPAATLARSSAGIAPTAPASLVLLTTKTPPGSSVKLAGRAFAYRKDGAWAFTKPVAPLDRSGFPGEVKSDSAAMLAADLPEDEARLKSVIAAQVAYAMKVKAAMATVAAELEQERQRKSEAFTELLKVGTLFTGMARVPRGETYPVVLEITENIPAVHRITALLRNDGGWADARTFRGTWNLDENADMPKSRNAETRSAAGSNVGISECRNFRCQRVSFSASQRFRYLHSVSTHTQ